MSIIRSSLIIAALGTLGGPALASEITEITSEDFYAAKYYESALEDARVQKIKGEAERIKTIAKSIKLSPKDLKAAIEKVGSLGGDPAKLAVAAIRAGAKGTRVEGRILDVLINDSEPKHVVAYVRFRGASSAEVIKDASAIAHIVASQTPLVSTLSLSAIHPKAEDASTDSVWGAKIASARAGNINPKRIDEYADRMYKRLFEVVDERPF